MAGSNGRPRGTLIIIGGHEEKASDRQRPILKEVARRARGPDRRLAVLTVASQLPEELGPEYEAEIIDGPHLPSSQWQAVAKICGGGSPSDNERSLALLEACQSTGATPTARPLWSR